MLHGWETACRACDATSAVSTRLKDNSSLIAREVIRSPGRGTRHFGCFKSTVVMCQDVRHDQLHDQRSVEPCWAVGAFISRARKHGCAKSLRSGSLLENHVPCCSKIPPHPPFIWGISKFGLSFRLNCLAVFDSFGVHEAKGVERIGIGIQFGVVHHCLHGNADPVSCTHLCPIG